MSKLNMFTKMLNLETDYSSLGDRKIKINKYVSRIGHKIRDRAKAASCCVCGKECSSFCNSHSIPQFSLRYIAEKGKVAQVLQGDFPLSGDDTGINRAGTFHLICRECDSTLFQEYEDPNAFAQKPTERILAQIALKNVLHMISKRNYEIELYDYMEKRFENYHSLGTGMSVEELDLIEYRSSLQYAQKTLSKKSEDRYHLCYFRVLDYVVPMATQSALCLVGDLEDSIINNIYNFSEEYHMASLHVAVFPLETSSVILLFVESRNKRYRKFIKQLNKLSPDDQLAAINYMVFSYTENTFLCPSVYNRAKKDANFMEVCRRTTIAQTSVAFGNPLEVAISDFSFSKRGAIPNLLSKEYALKVP